MRLDMIDTPECELGSIASASENLPCKYRAAEFRVCIGEQPVINSIEYRTVMGRINIRSLRESREDLGK